MVPFTITKHVVLESSKLVIARTLTELSRQHVDGRRHDDQKQHSNGDKRHHEATDLTETENVLLRSTFGATVINSALSL